VICKEITEEVSKSDKNQFTNRKEAFGHVCEETDGVRVGL